MAPYGALNQSCLPLAERPADRGVPLYYAASLTAVARAVAGRGEEEVLRRWPSLRAAGEELPVKWDRAQVACDLNRPTADGFCQVVLVVRGEGWQCGLFHPIGGNVDIAGDWSLSPLEALSFVADPLERPGFGVDGIPDLAQGTGPFKLLHAHID